jgi:predicted phosphodiesterase
MKKEKIIIISDLHLSHDFEEELFNKIKQVLSKADHIIINGDFWDDSKTTFEKFVNSKWNQLFPMLKEKNTIYLFGNHDPKYRTDERASLFSIEQKDFHEINFKDKQLYITHGQEISLTTKLAMLISRIHPKIVHYLAYPLGIWQKKASKNPNSLTAKKLNKVFKNKIKNKVLIMGHTHVPELDLNNNYINTGYFFKEKQYYLEISEDINLKSL